jgi:hypothetical protein
MRCYGFLGIWWLKYEWYIGNSQCGYEFMHENFDRDYFAWHFDFSKPEGQ